MDTGSLLEAAIEDAPPLQPSLHTCALQSSYSSSQALPPSSSDALPSSSAITFDLEDHDPPTEDEEPMRKHEPEKKEKESQKHDSQRPMKEKARRRTRRRRAGQSSFTSADEYLYQNRLNAPMSSLQTRRLMVGSSEPLLRGA